MAAEGIYIFLDDSNLWIEAKKAKGHSLKREFTEDPRLRIHIGNLADLLCKGRRLNNATIYGSEPPPVDTIWKKFEEKGWEIKIFKRNQWTGREKKVDTQIVADVTELVCDPPNRELGTTVVIVSGDNDIAPCIEKAIKRKWNVEVWAMEQSLGAGLKYLQKECPELMSIQHLTEEHLREITFISETFDINHHPRNALLNRGIVLQGCIYQLQDDGNDEFQELRNILDNFEWPWRHAWLLTKSKSTMSRDLLILFLACPDNSLDKDTPLMLYLPKLKRICKPNLCTKVLSYHEYTHAQDQDTVRDFGTPNMFNVLQKFKDDNDEVTFAASADMSDIVSGPAQTSDHMDEEPFQQVKSRKSKKHKMHQKDTAPQKGNTKNPKQY